MPHCNHCESFVTDEYVRVFAPRGSDSVECCPRCEDRVRRNGQVQAARSGRHNGGADYDNTTYDPDFATDGGDVDE